LFSNDELAEVFINSELFLPLENVQLNGRQFQNKTLFGRMLTITVWPTDNPGNHFEGILKMTQGVKQRQLENMSQKFYDFYNEFVKWLKKSLLKNKSTKDRVLQWFRWLINLNTDQMKMMPKFANLSTKGCFFNAMAIFLELCAPFTAKMSSYYQTFDKVDALYWASEKYLDLSNCDRINTDCLEEVKVDDEHEFHFITECFFITHTLIKISFTKVIKMYDSAWKQANDAYMSRDPDLIQKAGNQVFTMETHIFGKEFVTKLFNFLNFSSFYFWYASSSNKEEYKGIEIGSLSRNLVFDEDCTLTPDMCHIPEFFTENISKLGYMYRVFRPEMFQSTVTFDAFMLYWLYIIKTKKVSNPHARAETLKFVCEFAPKPPKFEFRKEEATVRNLILQSSLCKNYLCTTLIEAYGDVEKTGSHHQYYEKYQYRLIIGNMFHFILKDKHFQQQINSVWVERPDVFDKFIHFLIADVNEGFQLGISKLATIKGKFKQPYKF
jgi:ubiquitin conjugation factor E4 B